MSLIERNLFHMVTGSLLPLVALLFSHDRITPVVIDNAEQGVSSIVLWAASAVAGLAIVGELGRFSLPSFNRFLFRHIGVLFKEEERYRITGATYLLIATVGAFLFLDRTLAVVALLFLSLGDPTAALVGSRYGRLKIWSKTLEGSIAFLLVALLTGAIFRLTGQIDIYWPLAVGAMVAAVVELLPLPIDDNLLTPLMSGAVMTALL